MNYYNEKKIIKIQRLYRSNKIKKLWKNILLNFDLNNLDKKNFFSFTKILRNSKLINDVSNFIVELNKIDTCEIKSKILLTSFLICNFPDDIIGNEKNRTLFDSEIYSWSLKLSILMLELTDENNYFKIKKLINFINCFDLIFEKWKEFDKNRTIQNLVISYNYKMEHLEHIQNSNETNENDENYQLSINYLESAAEEILTNIITIDKEFNIEYLKNNYKLVYENIKTGMEEIINSVMINYRKGYLEMLISEMNKDNYQIIFDLINETNKRVIDISPEKYKNSIVENFNNYDYLELLLMNNWTDELIAYFNFLIDTVIIYCPPEDDNENIEWKNVINTFYDKEFSIGISSLLVEINIKIDYLYKKITDLI